MQQLLNDANLLPQPLEKDKVIDPQPSNHSTVNYPPYARAALVWGLGAAFYL